MFNLLALCHPFSNIPHSQPYVQSRKPAPNLALRKAEDEKESKYAQLCQESNADFYPLAFDIYGSIDSGTEYGITRMAELISDERALAPDLERSRLLHVISSLVIQRTAVGISRPLLHIDSPCGMSFVEEIRSPLSSLNKVTTSLHQITWTCSYPSIKILQYCRNIV